MKNKIYHLLNEQSATARPEKQQPSNIVISHNQNVQIQHVSFHFSAPDSRTKSNAKGVPGGHNHPANMKPEELLNFIQQLISS